MEKTAERKKQRASEFEPPDEKARPKTSHKRTNETPIDIENLKKKARKAKE